MKKKYYPIYIEVHYVPRTLETYELSEHKMAAIRKTIYIFGLPIYKKVEVIADFVRREDNTDILEEAFHI